jgi:hypothetical protein
MRMLDVENQQSVCNLYLYLSPKEAEEMRNQLSKLLTDPDANEHFHVFCENSDRELSCSIITDQKLNNLSGYTELERKILSEK